MRVPVQMWQGVGPVPAQIWQQGYVCTAQVPDVFARAQSDTWCATHPRQHVQRSEHSTLSSLPTTY
jgi:hypothetical protein